MGNWNINIQGVGCHHNKKPEIDVDLAVKDFVKSLREQGQTIKSATFTYGGEEDILASAPFRCDINGKTKYFPEKVSYEDVIEAVGYSRDRILSVTYIHSAYDKNSAGILHMGEVISVKNGTRFSVADTSNA